MNTHIVVRHIWITLPSLKVRWTFQLTFHSMVNLHYGVMWLLPCPTRVSFSTLPIQIVWQWLSSSLVSRLPRSAPEKQGESLENLIHKPCDIACMVWCVVLTLWCDVSNLYTFSLVIRTPDPDLVLQTRPTSAREGRVWWTAYTSLVPVRCTVCPNHVAVFCHMMHYIICFSSNSSVENSERKPEL